jgi:hypothetical protein
LAALPPCVPSYFDETPTNALRPGDLDELQAARKSETDN